jgi:broad specificity phosphatase PhoE
MRVGLLRHFPVECALPTGWETVADLQAWRERYDQAEAAVDQFDLGGVSWVTCLSSDLPRAIITAEAVFRGKIEYTALLREPSFASFPTGSLRLPIWGWQWLLRLAWLTGHKSQRSCRDDFQRRIHAMADRLCELEQDTLVVSHAGVMAYLSAELRRRGFVGPKLRIAKHATAFVYERT